ncbi:MAG: efflux RND transporter permease subunit [Planctomycetaceae bacterium]|nr:efflux RND transporter permease subunit [Planctomycetaceae bacterium]
MLTQLIEASLNHRFLVIVLVGLMAVLGVIAAVNIPIDAVPDMTNVQVQVMTDAGSLTPLEVEQYITYPVERAMSGLPQIEEIRSISKFGLSLVTIVFREGTDIYWARGLVNQRLSEARQNVAPGRGDPQMGVISTALGEVLQFEIRGDGYTPMQLRSILEWDIAPQLRGVKGVTEINVHGGFYKSYEVELDPDRMATHEVALREVIDALEQNNASTGGGYIVHHGEQRYIRGQSMLRTVEEIEQVIVRGRPAGVPLCIHDIGKVHIAPLVRQGAVTRDGRGEIVTGMVIMLLGENSREIVHLAKARLAEIQSTLPKGVELDVIYDRAHLIERTLKTVVTNLTEGGVLVIVILLFMLGSVRAGIVVALAIPLSMLFATNLMHMTGITASLMSLGAIDFGLVVDSSVIMIENCIRRLSHDNGSLSHREIIRDAAIEVRKPTMFGELIIAIVYLPILGLQGVEGKLFRPMALTVLFALAGSLVLSLTLMPVLASLALPRKMEEKDVWLIRLIKRLYEPALDRLLPRPVLIAGAGLAAIAICVPIALGLGAEFMPRLDEGDFLVEAKRLPSATLEGAVQMSTQIENVIKRFPEVKTVFCKTGRPEIANDVMGVHQTDVWIILHEPDQWPKPKTRDELAQEFEAALVENVKGVEFGVTQPIEMRVNELVAGVKKDVAVFLYGDDMELLKQKTHEIETVLGKIAGASACQADYQDNIPAIEVTANQQQLARYGLTGRDVIDTVTAVGGLRAGEIYEGRARYPLMIRYPQAWRENAYLLERLPVRHAEGVQVPLREIAAVKLEQTPPGIDHEAMRRRTFVGVNVVGRDMGSFVFEAQRQVKQLVKLPPGYYLRWGGNFENLISASRRLAVITPFVLLLIFLLLYTSFHSAKLALLIFLAVPVSACGGILALWLRDMPFSISAGVGFIALFGVAVLNGLVWVSSAEHQRDFGMSPRAAARETSLIRIRPVLMTALVAGFGFVPMAFSTTAGAEIQRPLATVVIGGLVTSTLLTALIVPAIYPWFVSPHEHKLGVR